MSHLTALKRFVEDCERELAEVEDPAERIILASRFHNEMLRRFPAVVNEVEIDGELVGSTPLTQQDVEDKIMHEHYDREDKRDASDFAKEGCYLNDDGDGEPRLRGMKVPSNRAWPQIFKGMTDDVTSAGRDKPQNFNHPSPDLCLKMRQPRSRLCRPGM